MEIITSHTNADFDALASMVAAKKLHPGARLVFPGSQEKSMRDFFLQSALYALEVDRLKNIDVDSITGLIIVDNRNPARLGKLAGALKRPGVKVSIYDHHPPTAGDIRGELEIVEQVGATTTIMVELLRQKAIPITPLEATIFALGIYEETGSLTFVSTTERDAQVVAYLLSQGAQLNIVADFISRELTVEQVAILNNLIESAKSYDINGVPVVITTLAVPHYVPDLAILAHKIRDMEGLDALFLVVQMGDKTHVIARSRVPVVNVGMVLGDLGGGGHPTAASAVVRDMTHVQTAERLIELLKQHIKPGQVASEVMSSPVKTIPSGSTIAEAGEAMTRFSVNVLPIMDNEKFLGIITREVVQKALFHELGKQKVEEFMTTGGPVASPAMPMGLLEKIMIEEHQRFLPVLDKNRTLVGAITRTDLLRSLHEERLDELAGIRCDHAPVHQKCSGVDRRAFPSGRTRGVQNGRRGRRQGRLPGLPRGRHCARSVPAGHEPGYRYRGRGRRHRLRGHAGETCRRTHENPSEVRHRRRRAAERAEARHCHGPARVL